MAKKEILNNDALTLRVGEPVGEFLEDSVALVEDTVERVVTVTKNNPFVLGGVLLLGAAIGGFAAYKITEKRMTLKYETILAEEIEAAKTFYKRLAKEGEFSSPESAVGVLIPDEVVDAVKSYQGKGNERVAYDKIEASEEVEVEASVKVSNVFTERAVDPRDWNYDRELAVRAENPDSPYVISYEEFEENPENHDQNTLTYFAGDDTLADEKEEPIDNVDYVVGEMNLTRFGHGSNDSNVVYIRNEKIDTDFEVIHSSGEYMKEVHGIDSPSQDSLRHSQRHPNRGRSTNTPRKFRERNE